MSSSALASALADVRGPGAQGLAQTFVFADLNNALAASLSAARVRSARKLLRYT